MIKTVKMKCQAIVCFHHGNIPFFFTYLHGSSEEGRVSKGRSGQHLQLLLYLGLLMLLDSKCLELALLYPEDNEWTVTQLKG